MENCMIVEYVHNTRFMTYQQKAAQRNRSLQQVIDEIGSSGASHVFFIVPLHVGSSETHADLKKMAESADVKGVIAARPSVLCLHTFGKKSMLYININLVDRDEICTLDCGSVIKGASCKVEADEIKKSVMSEKHSVECQVEVICNGVFAEDLCSRFEGPLDIVVSEMYNTLNNSADKKDLATCIYVNSRSSQLSTSFKNKFMMSLCVSEGDRLSKVTFLEVPKFMEDVPFIWETVEKNAVLIGALRAMSVHEHPQSMFVTAADLASADTPALFLQA